MISISKISERIFLEVQDRIDVCIKADSKIIEAIEENLEYFKNEILAVSITYDVLNFNIQEN